MPVIAMSPANHPDCYFAASTVAAVINFPLWKASAIAQAGFKAKGNSFFEVYLETMKPPYKGMAAVIGGMAWARGAIFYGSDSGKTWMIERGFDRAAATVAPTLAISTLVQVINQPIVRASITLQDPASSFANVREAARGIVAAKGLRALWHGTSAGIMKTVPKYITAIAAKDAVEAWLPRPASPTPGDELSRSAVKSVAAGVAGAALTNPLDVLRNEMFKTELGVVATYRKLVNELGYVGFITRGMGKNLVAVAVPISITIFATDALVGAKGDRAMH